jgi:NHLM bacteriocin system ABC transporter peptidase/ATP-binding protein
VPKGIKKVPTVLQMEAVECGAASLTMILGYFKKYIPLEEVREKCGVSRDGSKASYILKAARFYDLEAQGYREDAASVLALKMPLIIHWNMDHFIVLEGESKGKYYLNDPATGKRFVDKATFNKSFTGIAIEFTTGPKFEASGNKNKIFDVFKKQLFKYSKEILYVSFTGLIMTIPTLLIAWLAKVFLDDICMNGRVQWIYGLIIGILLVAVLKGISNYLYRLLNYRLLEKIRLSETSRLIWKTIHLPVNFFMQRSIGDISARVKNVDNISNFMAIEIINAFSALLAMIVFSIVLFIYNPLLTGMILILFTVNMLLLLINAKNQESVNNRISLSTMKLMGNSISDIQLIETIKTTSSEQAFFEKWSGYQAKITNEKQEASARIETFMNLPSLISMLASIVVLYVGGDLIINGKLTVGTLVAFQSIMTSFFAFSSIINQTGIKFPKALADMKRVEDIHNYSSSHSDTSSQNDSANFEEIDDDIVSIQGHLKIENLTFGFNSYEDPLIKDFSLDLKPGKRVALVGSSGSGKSTIAKLIAGIYKPWSGEIYLDLKAINTFSNPVINKVITMVDQEIVLFAGTISENISLWQQVLDEAQLIKAARNACIHSEIAARPGGYQYVMLEDGQDFSGGQKQRIELARAFLHDPRIMILDEATSALDPATELLVDLNLRKQGYTCIIVAHRLSTIRDCDEIIVLDKGKIIQRGNHESLLKESGLYAELIKTM